MTIWGLSVSQSAATGAEPVRALYAVKTEAQRPAAEPRRESVSSPGTAAVSQGKREQASTDREWSQLIRAHLGQPEEVLALVEQARSAFPHSPEVPEWWKHKIDALSALDRWSEARGEAERMVREHQGSAFAREVQIATGAHPRPARPTSSK